MRNVRMDIAAYVVLGLAGVVLAFAGLHGFHNKSITIISFGIGAGLVIISGCLYWQDAVWKHDKPNELDKPTPPALSNTPTPFPPKPLPVLGPSVAAPQTPPLAPPTQTPTPTSTPTPPSEPKMTASTPTPEVKSDTSYENAMTPEEVTRKLSEAHKQARILEVRKALVDVPFDGKLLYWSAEFTDDNQVNAFFISRSVAADAAETDLCVSFLLPKKEHERLPLTDRYVAFRTEGVIKDVSTSDVVRLKDVRLKQITTLTEPTPMKEKEPNITTGDITSVNQGPGSFTGVNTGTVNLGPKRRDITDDKESVMLSRLRRGPKGKVLLCGSQNDLEAVSLLRQIDSILKKAEFERLPFRLFLVPEGTVGLRFLVKDKQSLPQCMETIADALFQAGFKVSEKVGLDAKLDADTLVIIVGANPANQ